jgi:hypothetical protein
MLSVMFSMISAHTGLALTALDTSTVNKSVVFRGAAASLHDVVKFADESGGLFVG